ncbi:MMPL family transporter [Streptomyces sp. NPDC060048]|uniref:MMPL family transporter n=1 Tax=unclassified Streptomyces TaxID=2593676 RepID=UPI00368CCA5A
MNRLTRLVISRPKAVVAAWILLLLLTAPFALQLNGVLKAGGFSDPNGEAARAQSTLTRAFHEAPNTLLVVLHDPSRPVAGQVAAARAAIPDAGVAGVADYRTHPTWLSKDGHTTFVQVGYGSSNTTVQNLVPRLRSNVAARVGSGVQVEVTGAPALDYALNMRSAQDGIRAELIAFPVLIVVLLFVFRSIAAMAVPLVLAGVTLGITQGAGYFFGRATDLSVLFTNIVSLVGLAVSVDYSLFIVKRFRGELDQGHSVPHALQRTMQTVGHSVLFSGLAVIVALSALFIPRAMSFTSIALGGVTVTVVALAMSMTLLPAVLSILGTRINWGTLPRRSATTNDFSPVSGTGAARALKRPAALLVALVAVFAACAFPITALTLQVPVASAGILPASDSTRVGIERIKQDIGLNGLFPVQIVLTARAADEAALLQAVQKVTDYARSNPEASGVQSVTTVGVPAAALPQALSSGGAGLPAGATTAIGQLWTRSGNSLFAQVVVTSRADPDTLASHNLVKDLRSRLSSLTGSQVTAQVAGATAVGVAFDDLVLRSIPLVVGAVALATFLLLLFAFRSALLPLLALAFNAMVVAASLGTLALISQNGEHVINSVTPPMLFAVMFGLSMDYMVIMIARMRECYREGATHSDAVLGGLARTAGMVNGAAVIMVAVFASFTSAQISIVRELGISLAVAVILDALVIRRFVMPAALLLIGPRAWGRRADPVQPSPDSVPDQKGTVSALVD